MAHSKSKAKSRTSEDRFQAVELRKLGLSYREIGERIGLTPDKVKEIVSEEILHLEELSEGEPRITRRLQLERINKLRTALMAKALKGDTQAVNALLKCDEHEAKLLNEGVCRTASEEYVFRWEDETGPAGAPDSCIP